MAINRMYIKEDLDKSFETLPSFFGYKPGDITREEFDSLIQMDPTYRQGSDNPGKYIKWLLKVYKTNKRLIEDAERVKEYLTTHAQMVRTNTFENARYKDIMSIPNMDILFDVVSPYLNSELKSNKEKKSELKGNVRKIYEDKSWVALIPLDVPSACSYGSGTRWCTSSEENNMFYNYANKGPLIIVIKKDEKDENGRALKWQFHHETDQYMDFNDRSINIVSWRLKYNPPKELMKAIVDSEYLPGELNIVKKNNR